MRVAELDADGLGEVTADDDTEACGAAMANPRDARAARVLMTTILAFSMSVGTSSMFLLLVNLGHTPFLYLQHSLETSDVELQSAMRQSALVRTYAELTLETTGFNTRYGYLKVGIRRSASEFLASRFAERSILAWPRSHIS